MDALRVFCIIFTLMQVMSAAEGQDSKQNSGISGLAGYFFRLRPVSVDPSSVNARSLKEDNYVTFHLVNRVEQRSRGRSAPREKKRFLRVDQEKIGDTVSRMNHSLPTMIIIHGFLESYDAIAIKGLISALNRRGKWNVIVADWRKLSAGPWYPWALMNTRAVGRYVASFIDSLAAAIEEDSVRTANDIPRSKRSAASSFLKDLHVVGFSLGAQAAGIAGHYVTAGKIGRITGLDPAYPLIELLGPKTEWLDKSDAEFVDVIHTSGGTYGIPFAVGHADFFPNGGRSIQPGCSSILFPMVCSHWRAWRFFSESILNEQSFQALPCDSWKGFNEGECDQYMNDANNGPVYMGVGTSTRARGKYYLKTYPESPFSMPL